MNGFHKNFAGNVADFYEGKDSHDRILVYWVFEAVRSIQIRRDRGCLTCAQGYVWIL